MKEVRGTIHKQSVTDYHQRCAGCGKMFYFMHDINRKWVICPHCGHKQ